MLEPSVLEVVWGFRRCVSAGARLLGDTPCSQQTSEESAAHRFDSCVVAVSAWADLAIRTSLQKRAGTAHQ